MKMFVRSASFDHVAINAPIDHIGQSESEVELALKTRGCRQRILRMSSSISMNPLLLSFSDKSLETKYTEWRTRCTFVAMDRTFCYVNLFSHVFLAVTEFLDGGPYVGIVLLSLSIVTYLFQLLLIDFQDGRFWLEHRICFVLPLRVFRHVLSVVGIPLWVRGPPHNWPTFVRTLVLKSGALLNVWMAFGMPVILSQHLLIHIPLSLLMLVATGWPSCRELIQTKGTVDKISLLKDNVNE